MSLLCQNYILFLWSFGRGFVVVHAWICYASMLVLSEYALRLTETARSRYEEKVRLAGGVDPFTFAEAQTAADILKYPKDEYVDIKDSLVDSTSFITREQFKAHKALESHNYATSSPLNFLLCPRFKLGAQSGWLLSKSADGCPKIAESFVTSQSALQANGTRSLLKCRRKLNRVSIYPRSRNIPATK